MQRIFENDWMMIVKQDDKYMIQYNSGDLTNSTQEIVVTEIDALKAQESPESAYDVIIKYQNLVPCKALKFTILAPPFSACLR